MTFSWRSRAAMNAVWGAVQHRDHFRIPPEPFATQRDLLKGGEVARIQFAGALEFVEAFLMTALPANNVTAQLENARVVRQSPAGDLEFGQRLFVLEISLVEMLGPGKVSLATVGTQTQRVLHRLVGLGQARWRVIDPAEVSEIVDPG